MLFPYNYEKYLSLDKDQKVIEEYLNDTFSLFPPFMAFGRWKLTKANTIQVVDIVTKEIPSMAKQGTFI